MESARSRKTGKIIEAEELWNISSVDPLGYKCRGCGVLVTPCSYKPENKVRPYFRAVDGHIGNCDVDGEVELVRRAQKQRVTTADGFPSSFPNQLRLRDTRYESEMDGTAILPTGAPRHKTDSEGSCEKHRSSHWAAQTIRPICRTFLNYPYDRDLPLDIPDILANTYQGVFRKLKSDCIIQYPDLYLFYAPINWRYPISDDSQLEILLSYGEWQDKKLVSPYRVRVNWKSWSKAKRNYVSKEIEVSKREYIKATKRGDKEKGWLFFIGKQDKDDFTLFHVDDHRLICCLVGQMIYS